MKFNEHTNDLGDWCPWSGEEPDEIDVRNDCCPATCRASYVMGVDGLGDCQ